MTLSYTVIRQRLDNDEVAMVHTAHHGVKRLYMSSAGGTRALVWMRGNVFTIVAETTPVYNRAILCHCPLSTAEKEL
jgi:hypothetical protein